jgi:hypothetical protein
LITELIFSVRCKGTGSLTIKVRGRVNLLLEVFKKIEQYYSCFSFDNRANILGKIKGKKESEKAKTRVILFDFLKYL